jgi:DNA excision repair protein ERCC-5
MHGPDRAELDPADAETKVTANDEALALTLQREELGEDENEADPELARALALSRATGRVSKSVSAEPIPVELPSSEDEFEEIALVPSGSATPAPEPIVVDDSEDEDDFELVEVAPKSKTQPQLAALLKGSIPVASSSRAANLIAQARPQVPQPRIQPLQEPTPPQQYIAPLPDSSDSDEFEEVPTPVLSRSASRPREPGHAPAPAPAPAPEPESEPAGFQLPRRREAPRPRRNLTQLIQMARPKSPEREPELESEPDAGPALRYPSLEAEPERRRGAPSPSPEAAFIDDGPFAGMQVRRRAPSPPSPSPPAEISVPKRQLEPDDEPEDFEPEEDELTLQNSLEPTLQNNAARPYDLDSEEEDDDAIEWSRSPTPQPRTADTSTSLQRAYSSAQSLMSEPRDDDDDEMAPADMVNEEDDYARFLAQIKNRDLNEVREEIDDEIRVLNNQAKAAIRDSDEITQSMVSQIQTLLRHFGIPYITAPMEAEAQCAKLAELGLVDGVITDDSDVFLFGAVQCFKNIFNDAKFAECFLASDIERELSLTRERLVSLSYLLGSDYTLGLTGVGPVLALELLANFPGPDGLVNFRQWWLRVQTATDSEEEADTKWKKAFVSRAKTSVN